MTYILKSLRDNKDGTLSATVILDDGDTQKKKHITVAAEDYSEAGSPVPGDVLYTEDYHILIRKSDADAARERAYAIMAAGDNSANGLYRKLLQRGFQKESAENAVAHMLAKGFIRESEQLSRFVVTLANTRLYGKRRITAILISKGYRREDIDRAIADATGNGDVNFSDVKRRLAESRFTPDMTDEEKRGILFRYGF